LKKDVESVETPKVSAISYILSQEAKKEYRHEKRERVRVAQG